MVPEHISLNTLTFLPCPIRYALQKSHFYRKDNQVVAITCEDGTPKLQQKPVIITPLVPVLSLEIMAGVPVGVKYDDYIGSSQV